MPRYIICLSSHALKLHKTHHPVSVTSSTPCHSFSASGDFVTLSSPTLPLLSAIHLCLFVFSLSWEVMGCGSACPRFSAALGVCLFCYQAAVYGGLGLHGSLCFASTVLWLCLCWRCRGASIKLPVFTSAVADLRKSNNIWSLLHSTFGVGEGNFKNAAVKSMNSPFVLFTAVELKDFSMSKRG